MKLILVRRTDTGQYEGLNRHHRWVEKSGPRTFGRWCDFGNHLNYVVDAEKYLGVDYSLIELVEIRLEGMSTKITPLPQYLTKFWSMDE